MVKTLTCTDCRVEFTYDHRKGPTRQRCDPCTAERKRLVDNAKRKRWVEAHPEQTREQMNRYNRKRLADPEFRRQKREDHMFRVYGLTMADFEVLLEQQGGVCAICSGPRSGPGQRFHVDHCHDTNKVRGLLCGNCNTAIGLLGDDPERAEKVADYLRR